MIRRDVTALARLLDGDPGVRGRASRDVRRLSSLAGAVQRTANDAAARPRPEFAGALRTQLVDAARTNSAPAPLLTRMWESIAEGAGALRYSTRLAAVTGAAALALSGGGVTAAAERSLPGHALYPLKLAIADAQLLFVRDTAERGARLLAEASERLDEAHTVARHGDMQAAAQALRAGEEAARRGASDLLQAHLRGHGGALDALRTFADTQRDRVTALHHLLAGDAAEAARELLVTLDNVYQRVVAISGDCSLCGRPIIDPPMVTADAPSLDLIQIPEPGEPLQPFQPCPCVPAAPAEAPAPERHGREERRSTTPAAGTAPQPPAPRPAPHRPADPPETDPVPLLPPPLDQPVDVVDEVLGDLLKPAPAAPETPAPPPAPPAVVPDLAPETPQPPATRALPQVQADTQPAPAVDDVSLSGRSGRDGLSL